MVSCSPTAVPQAPADVTTYQVYFLGGQSNMEGFGDISDLPAHLQVSQEKVPIFHGKSVRDGETGGGTGYWSTLRPGHGVGFDVDTQKAANRYSVRFGPELSFGAAMVDAGERVAIIKFARGGIALKDGVALAGSWDPDYAAGNRRNQFDNALAAIEGAMSPQDIDGDGRQDRLVPAGIVWMQGEADAYDDPDAAANYARNLARLMRLLRAKLGNPDIPVVIGRIKDSGEAKGDFTMRYSRLVQEQQAAFVARDRCAALVGVTRDFGFIEDGWHYRSEDYVALGNAFAESMRRLQSRC